MGAATLLTLPLGITTKSDFVFTRPRPKGDMGGSELLLRKITPEPHSAGRRHLL
jgi:hypothetical protein